MQQKAQSATVVNFLNARSDHEVFKNTVLFTCHIHVLELSSKDQHCERPCKFLTPQTHFLDGVLNTQPTVRLVSKHEISRLVGEVFRQCLTLMQT